MIIHYTYRSTDGTDIQSSEECRSVAELRASFRGSVTPISSIEGVPEDLTQFIQRELNGYEEAILEYQQKVKELKAEILRRKRSKNIVGKKLSN